MLDVMPATFLLTWSPSFLPPFVTYVWTLQREDGRLRYLIDNGVFDSNPCRSMLEAALARRCRSSLPWPPKAGSAGSWLRFALQRAASVAPTPVAAHGASGSLRPKLPAHLPLPSQDLPPSTLVLTTAILAMAIVCLLGVACRASSTRCTTCSRATAGSYSTASARRAPTSFSTRLRVRGPCGNQPP